MVSICTTDSTTPRPYFHSLFIIRRATSRWERRRKKYALERMEESNNLVNVCMVTALLEKAQNIDKAMKGVGHIVRKAT